MKVELVIISGARTGHRDVFDKSYIGVGRHPMSDLRFDAEKDLDASSRHAALVRVGDGWVLRDLGSTNGTFVNGERLEADRALHDGDTLRFGVHGPEVAFHLVREEGDGEVVMAAVAAPAPAAAPAPPRPAPPKSAAPQPSAGPSKTTMLRAELTAERSRFRVLVLTLVMVLLGALAIVIWLGRTSQDVTTQLVQQVDSLTGELAVLRRLRAAADSEAAALRTRIGQEQDPARRRALESQLTTVTRRGAAIEQAQAVDYTAIRSANDRAVAVIYVRFPDTTQMWTGTAFSVTTGGLMLTNRHLVRNSAGEAPRDIAVQFSGSRDVLPARLVRTAPDADLAVIQLESQGPFPAVAGLDATSAQTGEGAPIALIGFPGGGGSTGGPPRATLVTGSVMRAVADSVLELDAFSGTGASGSPILGRDGRVVGVLFGGRGGSSSREILGLPISRAVALLR